MENCRYKNTTTLKSEDENNGGSEPTENINGSSMKLGKAFRIPDDVYNPHIGKEKANKMSNVNDELLLCENVM